MTDELHARMDNMETLVATNLNHANDKVVEVQQRLNSFEAAIEQFEKPEPQYDQLYTALAAAQGEITAAEANQTAEVRKKDNYSVVLYTFKYADLASCLEAIRKPLSDNGLALIQLPSLGEGQAVHLKTILGHSSGQQITCDLTMYAEKSGPQAIGTCLAYLRRYSLSAMIGVAQFDDDGRSATKEPSEYDRIGPKDTEQILATADTLFGAKADGVVARMLATVYSTSDVVIDKVADIPAGQGEQALNLLKNQAKREAAQAKKPKPADKEPAKDADREPGSDDE